MAAGQSWRIPQLLLHRNCVRQESCGAEMMHYTKKHVVNYCSTCGVVHVVVQRERDTRRRRKVRHTYIITISAKQTNDDTLEVMTNK